MHAEEGEGGVGDGVDEVLAEVLGVLGELEVLAAEGDDLGLRIVAKGLGDAVGVEAGSVDDAVSFE